MGGKKKHPTVMREIRELEKRLRNLEKEHNHLTRLRSVYSKSATNSRPYLAERIAAKFRPQTAPESCLVRRRSEEKPNDEERVNIVAREKVSWDEEILSFGELDNMTSRKFQSAAGRRRVADEDACFDLHNSRFHGEKHGTCEREVAARKTSSKASRHSARSARSADSRSSAGSRLMNDGGGSKTWVYKSMPLVSERQSIYTMVPPPVRLAEGSKKVRHSAKRRCATKGRTTKHRVPGTDLHHEHVVRFQGNPRHVYGARIPTNENPEKAEYVFQQLEHCRYLRKPGFTSRHENVPTVCDLS